MKRMTEQPLITPPLELAREWARDSLSRKPPWLHSDDLTPACMLVAAKATAWGWEQRGAVNDAELQRARDEGLELCEALILRSRPSGGRAWTAEQAAVYDALTAVATELRAVLRPKPPSLADQGLIELNIMVDDLRSHGLRYSSGTIRAALKRLKELEES